MPDDQRFNDWWNTVALPEIARHPLGRQFSEEIKAGAEQTWDAALTWKSPDEEETTAE